MDASLARATEASLRQGQTLADVQAERIPRYEHFADLTVEVSRQDSEQALANILQQLPL